MQPTMMLFFFSVFLLHREAAHPHSAFLPPSGKLNFALFFSISCLLRDDGNLWMLTQGRGWLYVQLQCVMTERHGWSRKKTGHRLHMSKKHPPTVFLGADSSLVSLSCHFFLCSSFRLQPFQSILPIKPYSEVHNSNKLVTFKFSVPVDFKVSGKSGGKSWLNVLPLKTSINNNKSFKLMRVYDT